MSQRRRQWIHIKQIQSSEVHMASIIEHHHVSETKYEQKTN